MSRLQLTEYPNNRPSNAALKLTQVPLLISIAMDIMLAFVQLAPFVGAA